MSQPFNPYREWLGLSGNPQDHYELLSLERFDGDQQRIAAAADTRLAKVRSFRPGPNLLAWKSLLDQIGAAKQTLLDPDKKRAYDVQLRGGPAEAIQADRASPAQTTAQAEGIRRPAEAPMPTTEGGAPRPSPAQAPSANQMPAAIAPGGSSAVANGSVADEDPMAPVPIPVLPAWFYEASAPSDRASSGRSASPSQPAWGSTTGGYEPLLARVPVELSAVRAPVGMLRAPEAANDPVGEGSAIASHTAELPPSGLIEQAASKGSRPESAAHSEAAFDFADGHDRPRSTSGAKGRGRLPRVVLLGAASGLVLLAIAVGLVVGELFIWPPKDRTDRPVAVRPAQPEQPREEAPRNVEPEAPTLRPPSESGSTTPQRPIAETNTSHQNNTAQNNTAQQNTAPKNPLPRSMPNEQAVAPAASPPDRSSATNTQPGGGATPAGTPSGTVTAVSRPEISPPTPARPASLATLLSGVRSALARRDVIRAKAELARAQKAATTDEEKTRVSAEESLVTLIENFWNAVRESLKALQPTSEIKVNNTVVAVVEASSETLKIRVEGATRAYTLATLPRGLALVLAEQWFDADAPTTKLALGAYQLVDPRGSVDDARRLWEEASLVGAETQDLMPLLDTRQQGANAELAAMPSTSEIDAQRRALEQKFSVQIRGAGGGPVQKLELARRWIDDAGAEQQPARQVAMLRAACDLAADAGNTTLLVRAVDELAGRYAVDAVMLKSEALERALRRANRLSAKTIARTAIGILDALPEGSTPRATARLAQVALQAARKSQDPVLMKQAADRRANATGR